MSYREIERMLGASAPTISNWKSRFEQNGMAALQGQLSSTLTPGSVPRIPACLMRVRQGGARCPDAMKICESCRCAVVERAMRLLPAVQPRRLRPVKPIKRDGLSLASVLWTRSEDQGRTSRRGMIVHLCSSDGKDGGGVVDVPTWMFDTAVCCLLHPGNYPSMCISALLALQCTFELDEEAERRCDRSASIYRSRRF
jgi:hypothetical protein